MVFSISLIFPHAIVLGSWIINEATGDISTVSPAIATTVAAEAQSASILTVMLCGYSLSILKICAAAKQSPPGEFIQTVMSDCSAFSSSLNIAGVTSSPHQLSSEITPLSSSILSAALPSSSLTVVKFQNFFLCITPFRCHYCCYCPARTDLLRSAWSCCR